MSSQHDNYRRHNNIEWELQQLENLTIVGAHYLTKQEIPDYPEYEGYELIPKNVNLVMEELRDVINRIFESERLDRIKLEKSSQ